MLHVPEEFVAHPVAQLHKPFPVTPELQVPWSQSGQVPLQKRPNKPGAQVSHTPEMPTIQLELQEQVPARARNAEVARPVRCGIAIEIRMPA